MKILAIDPGTTHSGVVIFDLEQHVPLAVANAMDNLDLLTQIRAGITVMGHNVDRCLIEDIQAMGLMVGNEVFMTAKWIGRLQEAWERTRVHPIILIGRGDVKITLCGCSTYQHPKTGKRVGVKDAEIKQAVKACFPTLGGGKDPVVGTKKQPGPLWMMAGMSHAYNALALVLTWQAAKKKELG